MASLGLATVPLFAAEVPAGTSPHAVLHLADDCFLSGELCDSREGTLRWNSPAFAGPLDFVLGSVKAVRFPLPAETSKAAGDYCFELARHDLVFGGLVGWKGNELEVDLSGIGRVHLKSDNLHRFCRWRNDANLVYQGPNGMDDWHPVSNESAWHEDFGHLCADQEGVLLRDLGLPARTAVELELSWKDKPDFVVALGVGDDSKSNREAFRFEIWGNQLALVREKDRVADVASIQQVSSGAGRVHIHVFLDQNTDRCLVFSTSGRQLAELKGTAGTSQVRGGVWLENRRGDIRLERLRIARWTGELPRKVQSDQPRVHMIDGEIIYGKVAGYDAKSQQFTLRTDAGESRIAADRIESAVLSFPSETTALPVRAAYYNGAQVSGDLIKVAAGELWMTAPAVKEPLRLPVEGLRSIIFLRQEALTTPEGAPVAMLELDGVRLRGQLVDGRQEPGRSCLVWQPVGSIGASAIRPEVSGRIVYREPPPPAPQSTANASVQRRMVVDGQVVRPTERPNSSKAVGKPSLYLRNGDTIPCEVTGIDKNGVSLRTPLSNATLVPHDKIKAVELVWDSTNAPGLTKSKRERLTTLPRMQKDDPPQHLIRSRNGDYLRGRIIGMDDKRLVVEDQLEMIELPRERIARIIWLHSEDLQPSQKSAALPAAPEGPYLRVQVLRSDGIRMTFVPDRFVDTILSGHSDVLGVCRVALNQIDELVIGGAIERNAGELAYQKWRLQHAVAPKFVQQGDSPNGRGSGTESVLVGKPAPPFELDLLAGGKFRLVKSRGHVVVLDFWATWCGPCLQTMPQVDRAVRHFADQGVQLIAVNLDEAPKQVQSLLERHKLHLTVALDRDGVVAEKYQASAIPQTVIIDPEGNVVRVFNGGGHLENQIREALSSLLPDRNFKEPSQ